VRVNTDAAFYDSANNGATACVLRGHTGAFHEEQATWYEQVLDALHYGSYGVMECRDGVKMASWLSTSTSGNRLP